MRGVIWFLLLAVAGLALAPCPVYAQGKVGGLGMSGDSLEFGQVDTIGPQWTAGCRTVWLAAQWSGDSANVTVQTSMDGTHWFTVNALSDSALGAADSVGIWFKKAASASPDTSKTIDLTLYWYTRMLITIGSADSTDQLDYLWGGIECAH